MHLRPSQIPHLAEHIVRFLAKQKLMELKAEEAIVVQAVTEVFTKNLAAEDQLNADAKRLLDQNKKKIGLNIDEEKAFGMIKRQLAKERNFVL